MRQYGNVVEIGIERNGEFGNPDSAPHEIKAIEVVMGGTVQDGADQLVTAARDACPNPNCCMSAVASQDSAEGGSWDPHPMNDTSYEVSFTRVDVSCSLDKKGCDERTAQLTDGIASMAKTCIDAAAEADAAARKKTDAAAKKANQATNTVAVKKARERVKAADEKAAEIKARGDTEAQEARDSVYVMAREKIVAS